MNKDAKKLCFVACPIGKAATMERRHSDLLLNAVIKPVLEREEFGYEVKRADHDADPGMISDRIISDILSAELVIADLTDLNPNVFYELGIRHSREKPTIHMAREATPLPFDNFNHRTIFVDLSDWGSQEAARDGLANALRAISAPGYKVSNPITQANASFEMRMSGDPRDKVIAQMQERLDALESGQRLHDVGEVTNAFAAASPKYNRRKMAMLGRAIETMRTGEAVIQYRSAFPNASALDAEVFIRAMKENDLIAAINAHRAVEASIPAARDFVMALQAYVNP